MIDVDVVDATQRMRFTAQGTDPEFAARVADAFAQAFVETRRDEAIRGVEVVQAELTVRADELRAEIAQVDEQLDVLFPDPVPTLDLDEDGVDETVDPDTIPERTPEVESLQFRRNALAQQLSQVIQRSTELGTSAESLTGFTAGFTPASIPTTPVNGDPKEPLGVAFVVSLALGIALAFARDHFDDVLRSEEDLKRATGGLPILGRIPDWRPSRGDAHTQLASVVEPTSHAAEAYRELSAGVRFLLVARSRQVEDPAVNTHRGLGRSRSVLVSSANIGEGKTATAANLAVAAARVGLRTVLVDADLRRSAVANRFGHPRVQGLSDALLDGDGPTPYLLDVGVPNLRVLTAGTIPPNPTELLASPAMRAMHERLVELADLVVYDTPAVLAVADALEIGPYVDLGVIVGRIGTTTRRRLESALERLTQVGTDISGAVLNGLTTQHDGYYYEYYLSDDDGKAVPATPKADTAPAPYTEDPAASGDALFPAR